MVKISPRVLHVRPIQSLIVLPRRRHMIRGVWKQQNVYATMATRARKETRVSHTLLEPTKAISSISLVRTFASRATMVSIHLSEARRVMLAVATPEHTKPQPARRRARHARPEPTKTRRAAARRAVCVTRDSDTRWSRIHWIVVLGIKRY